MGGPVPSAGPRHGRVASFDPGRGLGTVVEDAAGETFDFHATAIADGSRTIAIGAEVSFVVAPGHRGRYEARSLTPSPSSSPSPSPSPSPSHQRPA